MAFAILPLVVRVVCISLSFELNPSQTFELATETDAAASGMSVAELQENYITSHKLIIPARISYLLLYVPQTSSSSSSCLFAPLSNHVIVRTAYGASSYAC